MSLSGLHVLIIDEADEDRHRIVHSLRKNLARPLIFSEATTGAAGLRQYQRLPPPDIILLSSTLPDLPYLEVLQQLKGETGHLPTPVLVLTSVLNDQQTEQALLAGAQDIIDQQITPARLRHIVFSALARFTATQHWRASNEPLQGKAQVITETEQAFHMSELRFHQLADAMPQIVWSTDAAGRLNYVNQRWLEYSGMTLAATLQSGLWPAIHPDDLVDNYIVWLRSIQTGEGYESELRLRRADGVYCWHLERGVPIRNPQGEITYWFGTSTDIDTRKRAELNEKFLVKLGEQLHPLSDPLALITTLTNALKSYLQADHCIFHPINQFAQQLAGWQPLASAQDLDQWSGLATPDMLAIVQAGRTFIVNHRMPELHTGVSSPTNEPQFQIQSLLAAPCMHEGSMVAILIVADVTRRNWHNDEVSLLEAVVTRFWPQIESIYAIQTLKVSEDRLQLALKAGGMGIWQWDIAANQVTWDTREYELLGLDPQTTDLTPDTFLSCIHPDDRAKHIRKTAIWLEHSKEYQDTFRIVRPDGEVRWLDGHGTIIRDDQGQPLSIIGFNYDITTCKRQAIELSMLNQTLEQRVAERTAELLRRNQDLDQFAYVASHDLKAPLRAIDHLASWITEDPETLLSPTSQEYLTKLRGRIRRMQKLLDDLLLYSRADHQQGKPEPVDTAALIADLIRLLPLPPDFRITVEKEMPILVTQRVPLELILRNLLDNAIKHHDRTDGNVHVTAHEVNDQVEFSVEDDGPGIPEIAHQRIFQMFQTLQPRDKIEGSGMGLAIVKKIIESRGGAISVVSRQGRGAAFHFTWPKIE
ncbi:hypothetical protein BH10CHL1_BH10CHL1_01180 [soil metagenome]